MSGLLREKMKKNNLMEFQFVRELQSSLCKKIEEVKIKLRQLTSRLDVDDFIMEAYEEKDIASAYGKMESQSRDPRYHTYLADTVVINKDLGREGSKRENGIIVINALGIACYIMSSKTKVIEPSSLAIIRRMEVTDCICSQPEKNCIDCYSKLLSIETALTFHYMDKIHRIREEVLGEIRDRTLHNEIEQTNNSVTIDTTQTSNNVSEMINNSSVTSNNVSEMINNSSVTRKVITNKILTTTCAPKMTFNIYEFSFNDARVTLCQSVCTRIGMNERREWLNKVIYNWKERGK